MVIFVEVILVKKKKKINRGLTLKVKGYFRVYKYFLDKI